MFKLKKDEIQPHWIGLPPDGDSLDDLNDEPYDEDFEYESRRDELLEEKLFGAEE